MASRTDRQRAIDRADEWFSKYIRLKYSIDEDRCPCHTCNTVLPRSEMQAGHGIGGRGFGIRWLEDIVRPQCPKCNRQGHGGRSGNYEVFVPWIIDTYGRARYDEIYLLSQAVIKITVPEIRDVADEFRVKYNELRVERCES